MDAIKMIAQESLKAEVPQFSIGDTVRVDVNIREGAKYKIIRTGSRSYFLKRTGNLELYLFTSECERSDIRSSFGRFNRSLKYDNEWR